MKAIINIQDKVLGSWHQITVERHINFPHEWDIRVDGTTLPEDFELYKRVHMMFGAWEDEFEGVCDGKDAYLADLLHTREAKARERKA